MRKLLLLPLFLTGCGSLFASHDGTYLMTLKFKSNSCDPDDSRIGSEVQQLASLYRTADGNLALDFGSAILTGAPPEGSDFEVSWEQGTETSMDGCERSSSSNSVELEGSFEADLGFEGNVTVSERSVLVACPDDEEEVCTEKYSVTAMKLDAARARRPTGSIAWGYFGGGGY